MLGFKTGSSGVRRKSLATTTASKQPLKVVLSHKFKHFNYFSKYLLIKKETFLGKMTTLKKVTKDKVALYRFHFTEEVENFRKIKKLNIWKNL